MAKQKSARQLAIECARNCDGKKATHVVVLDVREITIITDFFVVCTVTSERQARAIIEELGVLLKKEGRRIINPSHRKQTGWHLMDFGDIVAHAMTQELREFYDLDSLWEDGKKISWKQPKPKRIPAE